MPELIGNTKNRALRKSENLAAIKETPVLPRVVEPFCRTESLSARTAGGRNELLTGDRNSEALTTLGATALQDVFAVGSQHAFAKSMTAAALGTARLECAFHKIKTLKRRVTAAPVMKLNGRN